MSNRSPDTVASPTTCIRAQLVASDRATRVARWNGMEGSAGPSGGARAVVGVGVPVEARLDGQRGGAAFLFREQTVQPVGRADVVGAGGAGETAGVIQGAFDGGSEVGFHGRRILVDGFPLGYSVLAIPAPACYHTVLHSGPLRPPRIE